MTKFCKDHSVTKGTFCTWQRYRRQGKYGTHGKFIALSVEPVPPVTAAAPLPVLASLSSGNMTIHVSTDEN